MRSGVVKVLELNTQLSTVDEPHQKDSCEHKKGALAKKLGSKTAIGTATQARFYRQSACRLADQRRNASPQT